MSGFYILMGHIVHCIWHWRSSMLKESIKNRTKIPKHHHCICQGEILHAISHLEMRSRKRKEQVCDKNSISECPKVHKDRCSSFYKGSWHQPSLARHRKETEKCNFEIDFCWGGEKLSEAWKKLGCCSSSSVAIIHPLFLSTDSVKTRRCSELSVKSIYPNLLLPIILVWGKVKVNWGPFLHEYIV